MNYSDGSSDTFTQSMSKWTSPQNYTGESIAVPLGQANISSGGSVSGTYDIYGYTFSLASSKTVASITLPSNSNVVLLGINCQTANLLPTGTALQIDAGAMLDMNGTNQQVGSLAGAGGDILLANSTLTIGNGSNTTFAGTLDGNGALTKIGSGTLTLGGVDTYSGVTTVSNGTLQAGAADAFSPNSTYVITAPGQLSVNGFAKPTAVAPTSLAGTFASGSEIDLTWTATPYLIGYQVQYQAVGQSTWTNFHTPTTASSANVGGLAASTQYAFRVGAADAFGDLTYSATTICSTTASTTQDTPPSVKTPLADVPNSGATTSAFLSISVFGTAGMSAVWSAISIPAGANQPTFTGSGSQYVSGGLFYGPYYFAYNNANFTQAGAYTFQVVVTDANGLSTTSSVQVTVGQALTSIALAPATVATGQNEKLTAVAKDQFGNVMASQPSFDWSVAGGSANGSVNSSGVYTAPTQEAAATVTVSANGLSATANIAVIGNNSADVYVQASDTSDLLNEVKVFTHGGAPEGVLPFNGPFPPGLTFHGPQSISLPDGSDLEASPASPYSLVRKNAGGTVIQTYIASLPTSESPWTGMVLDPNGTSFWACDESCYVYEFEINSGAEDLRFQASNYLGEIGILANDLPALNLLDDANNDTHVNSADQPLVNTDPGKVILTSDPSQGATANADSAHLAEMDISVTPNTSNGQTPANLDGWTLTLAPADGDSSTQIYDNPNKSNPSFGSSKTWTLSGGQGSATTFTTTVYVSEAQAGGDTLELTLNNPADGQAPSPSATAVLTATNAQLIAPQIQHNAVVGVLPRSLQDSQGAFVPLNNEDDTYALNGNSQLVPDYQQSGAIPGDGFLMPFVIRANDQTATDGY
ncbi:MAG TPA: fibronectin type III domain-containing protein, partial [Pirellulales bacterium]|nr:fibronectin type III domain-containing protein [Pirellulales bacterium]